MFRLDDRHALVCGSSQGIGQAAAEMLARQGARVTLVARAEAALNAVAAGLERGVGQSHAVVVADFAHPAEVRDRVAAHVAAAGPVDILVNNTGGPKSGPILDARPEDFTAAFAMHVLCNQLLVQLLAPAMKERRFGRIINIISTSVKEPIPGLGVSNTVRWAVAAWSKTLARELGPFGITVNNVLPGYTDTARLRSLFDARAQREGKTPAEVAVATMAAVPAGRFATPAEIAAAVGFLAAPEASYVNGVSLAVDGGRLGCI